MQEKNFGQDRLRVFEQLDAADSLNKYRYFSRLRSRGARTRRTKSEGDKGLPRGLWGWANAGAGRGMYWLKGRRVAYSAVHRSTLASLSTAFHKYGVVSVHPSLGLRLPSPAWGEGRNRKKRQPSPCGRGGTAKRWVRARLLPEYVTVILRWGTKFEPGRGLWRQTGLRSTVYRLFPTSAGRGSERTRNVP
jgi:hypothetical protein